MANRFQQVFRPTDMSGIEIFRPNTQLMTQVLGAQQSRLDNAIAASENFFDVIDVQPDIDARDAIMQRSQQGIEDIYTAFKTKGLSAGNDLLSEFERDQRRLYNPGGEAYNLSQSLAAYQAHNAAIDQLLKDDKISASRAAFAKQYGKEQFAAGGGTAGMGLYVGTTPPEEVDMRALLDEALNDFATQTREGAVRSDIYGYHKIEKSIQSDTNAMLDYALGVLIDSGAMRSLEFEALQRGIDPANINQYVQERMTNAAIDGVTKHQKDEVTSEYIKNWKLADDLKWERQKKLRNMDELAKRRATIAFESGVFTETNVTGSTAKEVTTTIDNMQTAAVEQTQKVLDNIAIQPAVREWQAANPGEEIDPEKFVQLVNSGEIDLGESQVAMEEFEILKGFISEQNYAQELIDKSEAVAQENTGINPTNVRTELFNEVEQRYKEETGSDFFYVSKIDPVTKKTSRHGVPVSEMMQLLKEGKATAEIVYDVNDLGTGSGSEILEITMPDGTVHQSYAGNPMYTSYYASNQRAKEKLRTYNKAKEAYIGEQNNDRTVTFSSDPWFIPAEQSNYANAVRKETTAYFENTANLAEVIGAQEHLTQEQKDYMLKHIDELNVGTIGYTTDPGREYMGQFDIVTGFKVTVPEPKYAKSKKIIQKDSYQLIVPSSVAGPDVLRDLARDPNVRKEAVVRRMEQIGVDSHYDPFFDARFERDDRGRYTVSYNLFGGGSMADVPLDQAITGIQQNKANVQSFKRVNAGRDMKISKDEFNRVFVPARRKLAQDGDSQSYINFLKSKGYTEDDAIRSLQTN